MFDVLAGMVFGVMFIFCFLFVLAIISLGNGKKR